MYPLILVLQLQYIFLPSYCLPRSRPLIERKHRTPKESMVPLLSWFIFIKSIHAQYYIATSLFINLTLLGYTYAYIYIYYIQLLCRYICDFAVEVASKREGRGFRKLWEDLLAYLAKVNDFYYKYISWMTNKN